MTTKFYKATNQLIAGLGWVQVALDAVFFPESSAKQTKGSDALGAYDQAVILSAGKAQIAYDGSYDVVAQIACTQSRVTNRYWARIILERSVTEAGAGVLTYIGGGAARFYSKKLSLYANKGDPANLDSPFYGTNTLTISGANDPLYNITGSITDFNIVNGWVEYGGIVGTPTSPDTSASITGNVNVSVGNSPAMTGISNVFSATKTSFAPISRTLYDLLANDRFSVEFYHSETNQIYAFAGNHTCFMTFERKR